MHIQILALDYVNTIQFNKYGTWVKYRLYSQELFIQQEDSCTPTHVHTHKRHVHTQHTHTWMYKHRYTLNVNKYHHWYYEARAEHCRNTEQCVIIFYLWGREQGVNRQRGLQRHVCLWLLCPKLHMIAYIGVRQVKGNFQSLSRVLCP